MSGKSSGSMRSNWVEWIALAVSVVAVGAVAGFLLIDGLTDDGRPPSPAIELDRNAAYDSAAGWIVPATVANEGDLPAEQLVLEAQAEVGGSQEASEVTVDFLPAGSQVKVFFAFSAEPSGGVEVRLVGFRSP